MGRWNHLPCHLLREAPSRQGLQTFMSKVYHYLHNTNWPLAECGNTWHIKFEPAKSQALTISHHRSPIAVPAINFQGTVVPEEAELRLLGIMFDKDLSFRTHIRQLNIRGTQRLGFLRKAAEVLGPAGCVTAYKGFVRPVLEYGMLTWMGASQTTLHTCQPYRIFRENHGKLTSIPVYRGIYKIYRIFKKIECTATSRDLTRAEYSKPCADSVLPRVLTSFLLEISVDLATCRLKACYLNRLPLLCSCGDSDLVGQVIWK